MVVLDSSCFSQLWNESAKKKWVLTPCGPWCPLSLGPKPLGPFGPKGNIGNTGRPGAAIFILLCSKCRPFFSQVLHRSKLGHTRHLYLGPLIGPSQPSQITPGCNLGLLLFSEAPESQEFKKHYVSIKSTRFAIFLCASAILFHVFFDGVPNK